MKWLACLCVLAAPAYAQTGPGQFSAPEGCAGYLTVQMQACRVENHYRCTADPEGHKREASFDDEGEIARSLLDEEARWLVIRNSRSDYIEELDQSSPDPHSLTDLFETGEDAFDFLMRDTRGNIIRYTGRDRLTGRSTVIDGVSLDEIEAEYDYVEQGGRFAGRVFSREFVSHDYRMFFSGVLRESTTAGKSTRENRPIEFIFPGEPGFFSTRPRYGCGDAIS